MKMRRKIGWGLLLSVLLMLLVPFTLTLAKVYRERQQKVLNQALIAAIKKKNTPLAISLLSRGADGNARDLPLDTRPLWRQLWDCLRGKPVPVAPPPEHPYPALLMVLEMKEIFVLPPENIPLVRALLNAGARVNVSDEQDNTPLIDAAMIGSRETVRLLLERGAATNSANTYGVTALHMAALHGDAAIVLMLLDHGASVNARDHSSTIALDYAASFGWVDVMRLLLEHGSDVNTCQRDGRTPLTEATFQDQADCVQLLIAHGANVSARDEMGQTPLGLAKSNHNTKIIRLFKKAGAKE